MPLPTHANSGCEPAHRLKLKLRFNDGPTGSVAAIPTVDPMIELLRTNDLVLISVVSSLLDESGIAYFVADEHMSVLEGSAGFLQRRVMVERDAASRARRLLTEAGFGEELKRG